MTFRPYDYPNIIIPAYSLIRLTYNAVVYEYVETIEDAIIACDIKTGEKLIIPDTVEITLFDC
ncbi:MAG: hypothetical protein RSE41_00370 [Clostridia bacterium]